MTNDKVNHPDRPAHAPGEPDPKPETEVVLAEAAPDSSRHSLTAGQVFKANDNVNHPDRPAHAAGEPDPKPETEVVLAEAVPDSSKHSLSARQVFKAVEVRLRFVLILAVTGAVIVYWDTIQNYWVKWTRPAPTALAAESGSEYFCPMHPSVVRPGLEPGGSLPKCPICGMPLSKRQKGEPAELGEGITGRVQISPDTIRQSGIATAEVTYQPLAKEIETVGFVTFDESKLARITSRVDGFVEKLYLDKSFVLVEQGDALAEIYSPELYNTAQELLISERRGRGDLASGSRERLRLFGVDDREIDQIVQSGKAATRLVIRSPRTGHVIRKEIVLGNEIHAGMTLFEVADLSSVWIEAEVFEKDISFLRAGQSIAATVEALPNRVFSGKISLVHPHLEEGTRTKRVRFAIDNPQHELVPGMYTTVRLELPLAEIEPFKSRLAPKPAGPKGVDDVALVAYQEVCPVTGAKLGSMGKPYKASLASRTVFLCCEGCLDRLEENPQQYLARLAPPPKDAVLAVPERAVVDTGKKKVVYVERKPGTFEGVEVELGPKTGRFYPVLNGLAAGDRVAAAGAFLIDAETRLNPAAAAAYYGASGGPQQGARGSTSPPSRSRGAGGENKRAPKPGGNEYDVTAKVVAVAPDKRSVTLDHEDIPGLMQGMQMEFQVASPKVLQGVKPGDQVQGKLTVDSGDYVITRLQKRKPRQGSTR